MSINTLNTKFKLRRDSLDDWVESNPTLEDGELVLIKVNDKYKIKIGDNIHTFSQLPYIDDTAIQQGGTLTAPLTVTGGDDSTAGKIILDQAGGGQITNNSTSTLFGFASAGDTEIKVGSSSYALQLRGKSTRPTYNGNVLALKSDIPTAADTGFIPVDANKSSFNLNQVYDASLKLFAAGTNGPKGITYGTLLTMPYRKASGNTKPDFGAQIFLPNGDDEVEHRNSLFFRTSLGNTWNEWQELNEKKPIKISTDTTITDKNINVDGCIYNYGYGIGWYTTSNNTREHIIFSPYFLKGTTVTYTESTWSNNYAFALSTGPSPDHDQTTDRRTNDSGWITSSTTTGTLRGEIGVGFVYDSSTKVLTLPYDGYISINVKKLDDSIISTADLITIRNWVKNNFTIEGWTLPRVYRDRVDTVSPNDYNGNINTINHRGWYECPENTLVAYRNSRYRGYKMVETDVDFTSDNVPVLLHDSSINRTARNADGSTLSSTININSITLEQARVYDFGIYKSEDFIGEKIPTFQEFIILCKNTGLHPYIELKGSPTSSQIQSVVNLVKQAGMRGKVTYISFQLVNLTTIKELDNKARLGLITEASTITQSIVNDAASLKNDYNEVFLDAYHPKINQNVANMCMNADIGLEAWTVDTFPDVERLPLYVSGFTTNSLNFDRAFLSANGFYYE